MELALKGFSGSRRAALNSTKKSYYYEIIHAPSGNHAACLRRRALRARSGKICRLERNKGQTQAGGRRLGKSAANQGLRCHRQHGSGRLCWIQLRRKVSQQV